MNDRYLYRAKRCDTGEWVEGNRIDDGVTGQVFIHASGNSANESDKVGEDGCLRFVAFEVDPSTICQCTGLRDNNGKLIWENDIIECKTADEEEPEDHFLSQVEWEHEYACFLFQDSRYRSYADLSAVGNDGVYCCKVVGNIFDSKKLMEM